ncbi:MAG: hypothetical protein ACOYNC_10335 [Bacteroidales bacterium]
MRDKHSFRSVLLNNEYKALKGKCYSTVLYLLFIFFITFLAFGFAQSTLDYQQKLSSDPYSNWINLNYHAGTGDSLRSLVEKIETREFRERFHIRGAYFYNKGMVSIASVSRGNRVYQYEARTIDPHCGIVEDLMKTGVCANYFPDSVTDIFDYEPNGVIISRKLVEEIGLDKRTLSFIQIKTPEGDLVPVPVLAVVNQLPDLSDIVYTNLFYCKSMNSGFYDRDNGYYRLFIENMDTAGVLQVLKEISSALEIGDPSTIQTTVLKTGNIAVLNWKMEIGAQGKAMPVSLRNERVSNLKSLQNHHFGQYFELSEDSVCDNTSFFHDYLAIEFSDLGKISEFAGYIKKNLALQLNLEVLTTRENYLFTGNIAIGAILLLMMLSIVSVSIYISSIIRNHLFKIRKNLGSFLAFGAGNNTLILLYIMVAVYILLSAMIPAFLFAFAAGELIEKFFLGKLLVLDPEQDYFSLLTAWFALFIFVLLTVAVVRTCISVRKILKHTPGDLVYERDS